MQTIDIKISAPELATLGVPSFWIRGYPTHHTFADLYQECINHPEIYRVRAMLEQRRDHPRHFWYSDSMMLRNQSIATVASKAQRDGVDHISLTLRRDLYKIGPNTLVIGGGDHLFLDAETLIGELVAGALIKEERSCCFDMKDARGRKLDPTRTLASYELLPAPEESNEPFPERATLALAPRVSRIAYVAYVIALAVGVGGGWTLFSYLLHRNS